MFKENTLFVVGAGASAEFDLPVGRKLSDIISRESQFRFDFGQQVGGNRKTLQWLQRHYPNSTVCNQRLAVLREISDRIFMSSSIDNFIDKHSNEEHLAEMGKLQIAIAIAEAERKSKLFFDVNKPDPLDLKKLGSTWIDSFARILMEKVSKEEISNIGENVSIICFNYDRCIEYYLIEAICQAYIGVEYAQAHEIVFRMNIIHPYGTLGGLPTERFSFGGEVVPFGGGVGDNIDPWPVLAV